MAEPDQETVPSEAVFREIVEKAKHPKTRTAVSRIKEACDWLHEKKQPISIAEVARFCSTTGPKAQSLRNNLQFKKYIHARAGEQNLGTMPQSTDKEFRSDDPQINANYYALQTKIKLLEAQLKNAKSALCASGEFDVDAMIKTGKPVRYSRQTGASHENTLAVVKELRAVFDPVHLGKFGLHYKSGRIVGFNGRVLAEADQVIVLNNFFNSSGLPPVAHES